jgi:hypothetical protein
MNCARDSFGRPSMMHPRPCGQSLLDTKTLPVSVYETPKDCQKDLPHPLHQRLQMHLDDHLRHAVADRGNSQRPRTPARFRDLHKPHRRWEVASRGHPIPDLVEVTLQVRLERLDRLPVHPGRSVVRLDLLIRFPDDLFGNHVRLRFRHRFLPSLVDSCPSREPPRSTLLPA